MVPDDVEKAMEALGLTVVKSDDVEVTARCPGHLWRFNRQDRNPSWSVNRQTGVHYCFSCGYKGTFMELVMDVQAGREGGSDIYKATKFIIGQGVSINPEVDLKEYSRAKGRPPEEVKPLDEARLFAFADVPFKQLKKRGLTREAADQYALRWSEADDCWILPIRLPSGALIGWQKKQGRFVRNHPEGVKKAQTFFGIEHFEEGMTPLVLESQLDVVRCRSVVGFPEDICPLATMGSRISDEQARILLNMADRVIIGFDNPSIDAAGAKEVARLIEGRVDKWGNRIEEPLIKRLPMKFLNYECGAKDIGDMEDDEILFAVTNLLAPMEALSCGSTTLKQPSL